MQNGLGRRIQEPAPLPVITETASARTVFDSAVQRKAAARRGVQYAQSAAGEDAAVADVPLGVHI